MNPNQFYLMILLAKEALLRVRFRTREEEDTLAELTAWIVGLLSTEEAKRLESRGWVLEEAPKELVPVIPPGNRMAMVWVDNDMFNIMSGQEWEQD